MHRLGDQVTVKLVEAAPFAGALRFELLGEGRPAKPSMKSRTGAVRREPGTKTGRRNGPR